jgi:hypothetical protein
MQQPALPAQQTAIREIRARYERGDLTFERFEYALNALIQAQTPQECQAILDELPASPITALDPLTPSSPSIRTNLPRRVQMLNVIGELKRNRRPWKMGQHTRVYMGIGSLTLDLALATMPPQSVLEVYTLIGEAKIYVPRNIHVTVRQFNLIGENKALGEERNGIFTFLNEEEFLAQGPDAATAPHLYIHMMMLIGSAKVMYAGSGGAALLSRYGINLAEPGVSLRGINLGGANLERVDLSGRDLEGAKLIGANLSGANLHGANLSRANLLGANLEDADLGGANLSNARLFGANLNGANLGGAQLDGANLRGANLDNVILFNTPGTNSLGAGMSAPPILPQPQ